MINHKNKYIAEFIPNNDFVYRRAFYNTFNTRTGKFTASAFKIKPLKLKGKNKKGFSSNWAKYSTPEKTSIDPRDNKKFCVGEFKAIIPRNINLDVNHTPSKDNQSHCTISTKTLSDDIDIYKAEGYIADNCIPIIINK